MPGLEDEDHDAGMNLRNAAPSPTVLSTPATAARERVPGCHRGAAAGDARPSPRGRSTRLREGAFRPGQVSSISPGCVRSVIPGLRASSGGAGGTIGNRPRWSRAPPAQHATGSSPRSSQDDTSGQLCRAPTKYTAEKTVEIFIS